MKGSVYSMIESTPTHGQAWWADSNHQSSSISQPSGHSRFSLRGGRQTLLYSIPVRFPLFFPHWLRLPAAAFVSLSRPCCFFICSWPDALSSHSRGTDLDAAISSELVRRLILFCMKSGSSGSVCYYHSSVSLTHWEWRTHNRHHLNSN